MNSDARASARFALPAIRGEFKFASVTALAPRRECLDTECLRGCAHPPSDAPPQSFPRRRRALQFREWIALEFCAGRSPGVAFREACREQPEAYGVPGVQSPRDPEPVHRSRD